MPPRLFSRNDDKRYSIEFSSVNFDSMQWILLKILAATIFNKIHYDNTSLSLHFGLAWSP